MATTEDYFTPRSRKAQRACHLCSATKVRCIAEAGSACHNCTRRGVECVTDQRIRRKRRVHPKLPGLVPKTPNQDWPPGSIAGNTYPLIATPQSLPTQDGFIISAGIPRFEWKNAPTGPNTLQPWSVNELTPPKSPEEEFWNTFTHLSSGLPSPCEGLNTAPLLPHFVKPLPTTMNPTTMEYLLSNGVLSLPSTSLQNALLQAFVECVLPSMPIIEWQSFLNAVNDQQSGHGSVSLLFFHAVMFSATTFVGLEHLLEAGYSNRREAHESFFQRVKLLYQTTYEADPVTAVQTLLLMTYRADTSDGADSRHWIKVAISTASSVGMFQDLLPTTIGIQYNPKLWKRIAWTCYMTDCQIALRLRCRPILQREDFNHQMLTEDDFEYGVLLPENRSLPPSCTVVRDTKTQKDLADICIANARLCLSISEILMFRGRDDPSSHVPCTPPSPESNVSDSLDQTTRVSTCEMDLAAWANSLPLSCHARPLEINTIDEDAVVLVQRSLLHMVFYTAVAILHQLQPFPSSKFCVENAAQQITFIASELRKRNLHDRLSMVGATATLVALVIHMSELKAALSPQMEETMNNFQLCLDVMASLRDVYWEANNVTAWALETIERIGLGGRF